MIIIKYITLVIALVSTLLFLSNLIVSTVNYLSNEDAYKEAKLRIKLIIIMSLTWPIPFLI